MFLDIKSHHSFFELPKSWLEQHYRLNGLPTPMITGDKKASEGYVIYQRDLFQRTEPGPLKRFRVQFVMWKTRVARAPAKHPSLITTSLPLCI